MNVLKKVVLCAFLPLTLSFASFSMDSGNSDEEDSQENYQQIQPKKQRSSSPLVKRAVIKSLKEKYTNTLLHALIDQLADCQTRSQVMSDLRNNISENRKFFLRVEKYGSKPLVVYASSKYAEFAWIVEVVELLVSEGCNLLKADENNASALYYALIKNNQDLVSYLQSKGAFLVNSLGKTLLHELIDWLEDGDERAYFMDVLQNLIANNHDLVKISDEYGVMPLIVYAVKKYAKVSWSLTIIKSLIAVHASVNGIDDQKRTALHFACLYGVVELVDVLLDAQANPNQFDNFKATPLHCVAGRAYEDYGTCDFLPCTEKRHISGPYYDLQIKKRCSIIDALFAKGAYLNAIDVQNGSPLDYAENYGHDLLASSLRDGHINRERFRQYKLS